MYLYHGTSIKYASEIMKTGFKSRAQTGISNWEYSLPSQPQYCYLTNAYAFYFAHCATEEGVDVASVLRVWVDEKDILPDEDFIRQVYRIPNDEDVEYAEYANEKAGLLSIQHLGNCCVYPRHIKSVERKDFSVKSMFRYCDPKISLDNYKYVGLYYSRLLEWWWEGKDYQSLSRTDLIFEGMDKRGES